MFPAIESVLSRRVREDEPGCAIAVTRRGQLLGEGFRGLTNLHTRVAVNSSSIFPIASMTKQFTAVAILMLVHDGKLSLNSFVGEFIPEMHQVGEQVTVYHLLSNTSGIRDQFVLSKLNGNQRTNHLNKAEIVGLILRQQTLNFPVGTEYGYCNSNFVLAAIIVERVSGLSFPEFLERRIFSPLEMRNTFVCQDTKVYPENAVSLYTKDKDGRFAEIGFVPFFLSGDAGMFSSLGDLTKWALNVENNILTPVDAIEQITVASTLKNGEPITYGLGLQIFKRDGETYFCHGGGFPGVSSLLVYCPQREIGVVILTNRWDIDPSLVFREVFNNVTKTTQRKSTVPKDVGAKQLEGLYVSSSASDALRLYTHEGTIYARTDVVASPMEWMDSHTLREQLTDAQYRLHFWPEYNPTIVVAVTEGGQSKLFRRPDPASIENVNLVDFAGCYHSPELAVEYIVKPEARSLEVLIVLPGDDSPLISPLILEPVFEDVFTSRTRFSISATTDDYEYDLIICFSRTENRLVNSLTINVPRAKSLKLLRKHNA